MTTTEFITAEHTTNPGRGVWVLLTTMSILIDGAPVPSSFVITTSTGYRATLRACFRDECLGVDAPVRCVRENCPQSSRTHCHRVHIEQAEAFAARVAKTYGSDGKRETSLTGLSAHPERVRNVSTKARAEDPYARALEGR